MTQEDVNTGGSDSALGAQNGVVYLHGIQFWMISSAIAIMMFIVNLEVPVVVTAIVAITDDLGGFDIASWVVSSYLLGYVAVIVIFAKSSDVFGRKLLFLISIAIFVLFSAACSAAQTTVQLIAFRALQGIGGGGCFSLCTILIVELVPPAQYTEYVSTISIVNALALLLGPIVGGAIAAAVSWRWIFIINVPIAAPAFIIASRAIPKEFPYHGRADPQADPPIQKARDLINKATLSRIDIPGAILILLATVALTAGFQEADSRFPWGSAYVITLLAGSGLLWTTLIIWERYVTLSNRVREPILPWTFITNRQMLGILLNFVLLGGPTVIAMFHIPQRFQLVYGTSGLDAGVRLIPFTVTIPAGMIFSSTIAGRLKVPPLYLLLAGSCLQVIGFALLGTLPLSLEIPGRIYGFEFIAGWGCGMNFALLFVLIPFVNEKRYHAVGLGNGAQFRFIGSAMVLAISTSVFNGYTRPQLQSFLGVTDAGALLHVGGALTSLPPEIQEQVRQLLAEGYNHAVLVLCVSAALQVPASLLMWQREQVRI
ncbi:putative multidrug resistance protein fnx1 [Hypoxylon trugodes]|uniref:putative multidrug resistance protein fnx1 n=1 Tax=Hypoxylon trugodes TaxID=326681 RepID=UPI00219F882A|nr:putative multidrug resistance protein fnx1 [Hypoxylon trugodes]KAI1382510.1 putative multidrug resistance protein fnx1 [Hypoxylon trugodes]